MKQTITLRWLLVLLAMVAAAPGIGVLIYLSVVVQRDEVVRAGVELESVAKLVTANQAQLIEGVRQILATVAAGPSVRRNDLHELCVEFLSNVQAATPSYANIGLLNPQGEVECQSSPRKPTGNASQRRFFRNAIQTGHFAVGDFTVGMSTGRKVISFGMPTYDYAGVFRGVAFAALDLEYAGGQLKSITLPEHLQIRVSDASGRLLVSHATSDPVGQLPTDAALRAAIESRRTGQFSTTDAQGSTWMHAGRSIATGSRDDLIVTVSIRRADVVAIANTHFQVQLVILGLASLLGVLLAWGFARHSLAKPVTRLLERMQRVERGQPIQTDPMPPSSAELAQLDAGFSSMMARLQTNQRQLLKAQEIARVGFFQFDMKRGEYTGSAMIYNIFGLDPAMAPVPAAVFRNLIHPDDLATVVAHRDRIIAGGRSMPVQYRVLRQDGSLRWVESFSALDRDADGEPSVYSGAVQDITERKLSEQSARILENRFRLLFENSLDGVLQTTPDGGVLAANSAACRIFNMTEAQLQQRGRRGVVLASDPRLAGMLAERSATGTTRGELTMVRGDGMHFQAEISSAMYVDGNGTQLCSIVLRDITERLRTDQYIHRLAFFDALTELPNRRMLVDRLGLLLAAAQRSGQVGGVLFIDLDHFKNVNDARGHAVGDALLRLVAQRLAHLVRAEDTVARIGGDEFVVLMPGLAADFTLAAQHAMATADKIRQALAAPFFIDAQPYGSGCSIGVTLLPKPGQTSEDVLREADTAMYRAKTAGRNRIAFFEAAMQAEVEQRFALEHDLAQAIDSAQLSMMMQPQFDHAGRAIGCELLMRWTHPAKGPIAPAVFIPVAEDCGLILALGDWAVREGCHALLQLQQAGCPMPVSVNVSPRQFRQADFVARVRTILDQTGAPPHQLIFEVTEGLLIDNLDDTIARMQELVDLGVRFSIDDFGTGYSSLGYLRRLPLYELKIDRSFIQRTPSDPGDTAIVQSILSLAGHLGLRVVAEGVETVEQKEFLRQSGCAFVQGYLMARPMPMQVWLQQEASASAPPSAA